ncbi:MAG: tRNA 2-selenouridine(34) synthase MnmH [Gammaproteobacteria bacterium]
MELPQVDDLSRLFLDDVPLLDVRAPVEFSQGAFPNAVNLPLIDDAERQAIGIEYKQAGQNSAISLGHELVAGELRESRVDAWQTFAEGNPDGILYCFRGGMRSKLSQQWLFERTGKAMPRVRGGYKAMRRFLLGELDQHFEQIPVVSVGGRTGSGKTLFLERFAHSVDLEGLANHRGSAFGNRALPQPAQIDFENNLAIQLLKHRTAHPGQHLLVEDEGRFIGSRHMPLDVSAYFRSSPLVIIEEPPEQRVQNTLDEYVSRACKEFQALHGAVSGFERWSEQLLDSLGKVKKRLGAVRYQETLATMTQAIESHRERGDVDAHRAWIAPLLFDYYDPMYDYQMGKNPERIRFTGDSDAVADYLGKEFGLL